MNHTPLVSVFLTCYNHEKYVEESINSILNQTYENLELIIFNDGSTDNSHDKILAMFARCSERFPSLVYFNKPNEGVTKTLNRGLKTCKGEFISLISADDTYVKDKIETLVKEFQKIDENYAVICGDADFIDSKSGNIYLDCEGNVHDKYQDGYFDSFLKFHARNLKAFDYKKNFGEYRTFLYANYIPGMSALIRKEAIVRSGGYDENNSLDDLDIYFKLSKNYKMKYVDKVLAHYRWHESNSIKVFREKLFFDSIKIYAREKKYCCRHGLANEWNLKYVDLMYQLLKINRYGVFLKYVLKITSPRYLNMLRRIIMREIIMNRLTAAK